MRLQDALDRFVVQLQADGRSAHTIDQYRRHVGLLGRWLASAGHSDDVDKLSHEQLAQFLIAPDARASRRGGVKKATSLNALRSSMRAFFGYVHAAGWSRENAARLIRRARCAGGPPRGLSDEDRERLLSALASAVGREARRDHALFHLMLATGIRLSAALALTDADVDLGRGELTIQAAKGNRVEVTYLTPALRAHLSSYLGGRQPGPLFVGRDARPLSRRHAARRLSVWMRRAGCRGVAHPHCLRHDFANRIYQRTGDILVVQQALGHRSLLSSLTYARADSNRVRRALADCP
jgi:site-specific recombinase XerD